MPATLNHDEFKALAEWFYENGSDGVLTFEETWELFKSEVKKAPDGK